VHCDIAQHMEKGMKAQLKVGKGDGDLPSIPGVTDYVIQDDYSGIPPVTTAAVAGNTNVQAPAVLPSGAPAAAQEQEDGSMISGMTVIGLAIGLLLAPFLARKFKGMSASEIVTYIFDLLRSIIELVVKLLSDVVKLVVSSKNKTLPGS
jgi:hypothetical protein